jgi:hypothetical protein
VVAFRVQRSMNISTLIPGPNPWPLRIGALNHGLFTWVASSPLLEVVNCHFDWLL